jgi:peptidoglycan/xylan/chitin deacetylase (PgdA/CDA1 family)
MKQMALKLMLAAGGFTPFRLAHRSKALVLMYHRFGAEADDAQLGRELSASKARLELILGCEVSNFCYPNGDADERVRRAAAHAGYTSAVTDEPGLIDARRCDPLALPRIPVESDFAHFAQSTSGFEQLKTHLRRRPSGGRVAGPGGEPALTDHAAR